VALTLTAAVRMGRSFSTSVTSDGGVACSGTFTTEYRFKKLFKLLCGIRLYTLKVHLCFCHCVGRREKGHMRDGPECASREVGLYAAENKMFASRKTRSTTTPRPVVRIFPGQRPSAGPLPLLILLFLHGVGGIRAFRSGV